MKVRIKNVTGSTSNEWLLWELKKEARVKEGDIVEGKFNPKNKAVYFTRGTSECVAWLGQTRPGLYSLFFNFLAGFTAFPGTRNYKYNNVYGKSIRNYQSKSALRIRKADSERSRMLTGYSAQYP